MRIRSMEDRRDRQNWDEFVLNCEASSLYHLSGWKDVIEESFGKKTFYLLCEESGGKLKGVLPLAHMRSRIFGNFFVSLPYLNYAGICANDGMAASALLSEAVLKAKAAGAAHIELRHTLPFEHSGTNLLQEKLSKVTMKLKLLPPDELWKALGSKLRSQISKPEKAGMEARIGKEEELESFYHVFSTNMRDLGTPVYSIKFFRNIFKYFRDSVWISAVYNGGEPVAAGFLAGFKGTLEIPWASSLKKYNSSAPNMLLYWNSIRFASENGFAHFDFGRCTPNEGTYRFKEQWGAKPAQLYWHYWTKDNAAMPEINPSNPKYRKAIDLWKKLPVWLTKIIGPGIIKNIP